MCPEQRATETGGATGPVCAVVEFEVSGLQLQKRGLLENSFQIAFVRLFAGKETIMNCVTVKISLAIRSLFQLKLKSGSVTMTFSIYSRRTKLE